MAESSTAKEEAARAKQQVKETSEVKVGDGDQPEQEAPESVPMSEHDQNLPASYSEEGGTARPYGMTADEVAQADAGQVAQTARSPGPPTRTGASSVSSAASASAPERQGW
jgi:hypothetical protein